MGIYLIADSTSSLQSVLSTLVTIVNVALGLSFVIFVHELGHFLAAKLCGVKCEKFYVGFDVPPWKLFGLRMPSRFLRFQWGETEYGIGVIPLGGYVKMLGQDDNPANAQKEAERIKAAGVQQNTAAVATAAAPVLDPRSYPAKTVPQRMFIISAGIIMNIIFAALMAAVAFRIGVNYVTCDFSGVMPGSPAWRAELKPGDRLLQVGRKGEPKEFVRDGDLREQALLSGFSSNDPKPIDLLVRSTDESTRWVALAPQRLSKDMPPTLGVLFARSNEVGAILKHMSAGQAGPELKPGDRILAVNGQALDTSHTNEIGQFVAWQFDGLLEEYIDQPITLSVERTIKDEDSDEKQTERLDVRVPPQPMKWFGFRVRMGPVTMIREGSPADQAGLKVGDVIIGVNGKSIGDPLTLPRRFAALGSRELTLNIWQRNATTKKYERRDLTVTPTSTEINLRDVGPDLSLEGIGLSYTVRNVVHKVAKDSPAAKSLKPGDRIVSLTKVAVNKKTKDQVLEEYGENYFAEVPLDRAVNWIYQHGVLQQMVPGTELALKIKRGKDELEVQLAPRDFPGHYYVERGVLFLPFERKFIATTWGEALSAGVEETKDRLAHVAIVLKLLLTGRVSAKHLGGPIQIAALAGHEANLSVTRLLMFLTFLSANLALINALPIPVLDGGHFLFLTIELVRRRPVPEEWQQRLSFLGLAALILLMFFVMFNDLRWLSNL